MATDTENEINAFVEKSKSTDVPLLITAKEELKRQLKDNPTAQNVAAFSKVNKELSSAVSERNDIKVFANYQDAIFYLQDEHGRKIGKTKFFSDITKGILKKQADGNFKVTDLNRYAVTLPLATVPTAKNKKNLDLSEVKLKEEIRKIKINADKEEFALNIKKGNYFPKENLYIELAARTVVLSTSLKGAFQARCLDLIHASDGNPQKSTDFLNEVNYLIEDALSEFAKEVDLEVIFECGFETDDDDEEVD